MLQTHSLLLLHNSPLFTLSVCLFNWFFLCVFKQAQISFSLKKKISFVTFTSLLIYFSLLSSKLPTKPSIQVPKQLTSSLKNVAYINPLHLLCCLRPYLYQKVLPDIFSLPIILNPKLLKYYLVIANIIAYIKCC